MTTLDLSRAELALIVLYLNKAEARDKICRAIQYGSKFLSGGQTGTAQTVDKNTSLARKVFRLFKVKPDCFDFSLCFGFGIGFIVTVLISDLENGFNVQFVNDFHGLISPVPKGTPLPLVLLGKVQKRFLISYNICSFLVHNFCLMVDRFSRRMRCCLPSCFLIKSSGLVDPEYIR